MGMDHPSVSQELPVPANEDTVFAKVLVKRPFMAKDRKGLADWLRRCAKNVESGEYDECRRYTLYEEIEIIYDAR